MTDRALGKVSLVVPVRNEERTLALLLESIRAQTCPPDEILLIDGGSADRTVALAQEAAANDPRFRVITAGPAMPGRGRNIGIRAARNEWVALTDAGIRLDPNWLARLVAVAERDPSVGVVYGNYEPVVSTPLQHWAALAYVPAPEARPGGRVRGPSIASCLLRVSAWRAVGGFPDYRAAEDLVFMREIERLGVRIGWAPGATVYWHIQPSLVKTFRRFALYSCHNVWAGQQAGWHYGLARQYAAGLVVLALAVVLSPWWLVLLAAGAAARVARTVWRKREGRGAGWAFHPVRLAGVGIVLATIDLATFWGWFAALVRPNPYRADRTPGAPVGVDARP